MEEGSRWLLPWVLGRAPSGMWAMEGGLLPCDAGRARGRAARLGRGLVRASLVLLSISTATAIVPVDLGGAGEFSLLGKVTLTNGPASLITVRQICPGSPTAFTPLPSPHCLQPTAFNPLPLPHCRYPTAFTPLHPPHCLQPNAVIPLPPLRGTLARSALLQASMH
jgi:hypothetical protein